MITCTKDGCPLQGEEISNLLSDGGCPNCGTQSISIDWVDFSIDNGFITLRAVSNSNFKEFFSAPVSDEAAIKEAVEEATMFQASEWEKSYSDSDRECTCGSGESWVDCQAASSYCG